jgi:hypothetical protein
MYISPSALGTDCRGTSRMIVAVARAQNPPTAMPRSARAAIRTAKFGAAAISTSDASINAVRAAST